MTAHSLFKDLPFATVTRESRSMPSAEPVRSADHVVQPVGVLLSPTAAPALHSTKENTGDHSLVQLPAWMTKWWQPPRKVQLALALLFRWSVLHVRIQLVVQPHPVACRWINLYLVAPNRDMDVWTFQSLWPFWKVNWIKGSCLLFNLNVMLSASLYI